MKKIPPPENQLQEVLFELVNRLFIDRRTMMLSCDVFNLTAQISALRKEGLNIVSNRIEYVNKFKRNFTFVQYRLEDKKEAVLFYLKMQEKQKKLLL